MKRRNSQAEVRFRAEAGSRSGGKRAGAPKARRS